MTVRPLQRANFVDQAYAAIKELIVSGELKLGDQLNIDALARRLAVSNSPIREALRRLEHERWVETIPFRGAFVRPLDAAELAELYEMRQIIELAALRKVMRTIRPGTNRRPRTDSAAAEAGTGRSDSVRRKAHTTAKSDANGLATLRTIAAQIDAAVTAGDALGYLNADARFHQALVDLAGNRRLADLFRTLVEQGRSFMLGRTPAAMARCRRERDEHEQLLDLIDRGDSRAACRLLRRHLRFSSNDLQPYQTKG